MNIKTMKVLEFDKIKDKLCFFASSKDAKKLCMNLQPFDNIKKIEKELEETSAAYNRIIKLGKPDFSGIFNVNDLLKRLDVGGVLNANELLKICTFLENTAQVKNYFRKSNLVDDNDIKYDCLNDKFENLSSNSKVISEIKRCIISDEEIATNASSNLKNIRRNIASCNDKIHNKLQSMITGGIRTYIQDSIITIRNDRYCIPIKQECASFVKGIIHDRSSTGSTIFIEPSDVVKFNNELKELFIEEKKEIDIILSNLSSLIYECSDDIKNNYFIMINLDFIFAKATLAKSYNGTAPLFNDKKIINLKNVRHPLLDQKKVIPIDIRLGDDFDLLIITGPNTGGKTVALKSIGLLTIMGLSGLFIPADEGSLLYPFSNIFADIGDEQSIEQSLSTFSAHMVNIVDIIKNADVESLCLFDELGAGTDPIEGAALSGAILEYLFSKKIRTVATTHYSELKAYALSTDRIENGGCEFDVETLSPTYKLLIGIPGKSNAFAISKKLGISDEIINSAKRHLNCEQERFEDILSSLDKNRRILEKEKKEVEKYKKDIVTLRKTYEERKEKIDKQKDKIIDEALIKADEILKEAKEIADDAIRCLNKSSDIKKLEEQRHKLHLSRKKNQEKMAKKPTLDIKKNNKIDISKLRIGDAVKVLSMNLNGTLSSLPDNKKRVFVTTGIIRTLVNIDDIELIDEKNDVKNSKFNFPKKSSNFMSKAFDISPEILLLGKTVDEAEALLNKYLDDAFLAGLKSVRIVHGKGTGALRNYVHLSLKNKSFIKSFKLGEYGEGDSGVTIAEFMG